MSPSSVHCCGNFLGAGRPDTNLPPEKVELPLPGPGAHLGSSSQLGGRGRQNPEPVAVPVTTVRLCWAGTSGAVDGTPCHPPPPHGLRAQQMPAQACRVSAPGLQGGPLLALVPPSTGQGGPSLHTGWSLCGRHL